MNDESLRNITSRRHRVLEIKRNIKTSESVSEASTAGSGILSSAMDNSDSNSSPDIRSMLEQLVSGMNEVKFELREFNSFKASTELKFAEMSAELNNLDTKFETNKISTDNDIKVLSGRLNKSESKFKTLEETITEVAVSSQSKLDDTNNRMVAVEGAVNMITSSNRSPLGSSSLGGGAVSSLKDLKPPIFTGKESENPMLFINNLEKYFSLCYINTEEEKIFYLGYSLKDKAAEWWCMFSSNVENFDHFKIIFMRQYWGHADQRKIRENLYNGQYGPNENYSREEYVIKKYVKVKYLLPPIPEKDIVEYFTRHFEVEVQRACIPWRISKIDELLELLKTFDAHDADSHNRRSSMPNNDVRGGYQRYRHPNTGRNNYDFKNSPSRRCEAIVAGPSASNGVPDCNPTPFCTETGND